ncbi:MAG: hypothetical protein ACXWTY_11670, partial [Methylobacter sp.]
GTPPPSSGRPKLLLVLKAVCVANAFDVHNTVLPSFPVLGSKTLKAYPADHSPSSSLLFR